MGLQLHETFMKFQKLHETLHEITWNYMKLHEISVISEISCILQGNYIKLHKISVTFWNFMKV